jgi:hypothetical protein
METLLALGQWIHANGPVLLFFVFWGLVTLVGCLYAWGDL